MAIIPTDAVFKFVSFLTTMALSFTNISRARDLEVMTFNIRTPVDPGENAWEVRRWLVKDLFQMHKPDLIGLQEAEPHQVDWLLAQLPEYGRAPAHLSMLYRRSSVTPDPSDVGILQLTATPEVWGHRHMHWQRYRIQGTNTHVYHYNTHFGFHEQQLCADRFIGAVKGRRHRHEPFFITGDFNLPEDHPVIKHLQQNLGAMDTFRIVHPSRSNVGTFGGFGTPAGPKIDFVFMSRAAGHVTSSDIIMYNKNGRWPSDHAPVTAKVQLEGKVDSADSVKVFKNLLDKYNMQYGVDFYGNDLRHFDAQSAADCAQSCEKDGACKYWTWAQWKTCYLKKSDENKQYNPNVVSGAA